jgi:crotonobetainyl-CoA:carnitine CoA-transferase CaiB-like acyl-CoA transferase
MSGLPLRGVRVLDAGLNIAGPYAGSLLADLGADVVKLEPPAGDPARAYPPEVAGTSTLFAAVNHRKRYLSVDLRTAPGREVLQRLVARADVVIQNMRPGKEFALGLDAAACHAVNPRVVHCSVEAFYPDEQSRPGYDLLVQADSGFLHITGEPGGGPVRLPAAIIDHTTGLWTALAAAAALHGDRDRATVRVSMLDVTIGLLNDKISAHMATGEEPVRMGSATSVTTPHGAYPTGDGWVVIGAATDAMFARLARVLDGTGDGGALQDERFTTQRGRLAHRAELDTLITEALRAHDAKHWLRLLSEGDVPAAVVRTLSDAAERHRTLSATGVLQLGDDPRLRVVAPALQIAGHSWQSGEPPGEVGRDTLAVLAELGYAGADIEGLRSAGALAG